MNEEYNRTEKQKQNKQKKRKKAEYSTSNQTNGEYIINKAISMMGNHRRLMRKCQKTEFCGGHLRFLAAILVLQWVLDKPVLYIW